MNNRGMLLVSETLKLVIAVICIGFLVYLLAMMYFSGGAEKEKEDATNMLKRIENITKVLEEGNSTEENSLTPGGWSLFSYAGQERRPNACAGQNCICICNDVYITALEGQLKECNKNGACFISPKLFPNPEIEIEEDGSTDIKIYREGGRLGVLEI